MYEIAWLSFFSDGNWTENDHVSARNGKPVAAVQKLTPDTSHEGLRFRPGNDLVSMPNADDQLIKTRLFYLVNPSSGPNQCGTHRRAI